MLIEKRGLTVHPAARKRAGECKIKKDGSREPSFQMGAREDELQKAVKQATDRMWESGEDIKR